MNIGIRLHDTKPGTLRERLGYAREQGFSCVQLAMSKAVPGFAMADAPKLLTRELAEEVKEELRRAEMECAVLGCYLAMTTKDEEKAAKTREIYEAHLRFAPWMGALVVGTETPAHSETAYSPSAAESEEAFAFFIDCLRPLVRCAEEAGAILAIEPVWKHIVSTPERAERMLDAVPSEHLQIILDSVNLISPAAPEAAPALVEEAIRRLGDRVRVLHMKDFTPAEGVIRSSACGTGQMRYERLLAFARERNLPMTLEDTKPDNAQAARLHLETIAAAL
jgi:sugar phosphate isomerase/epimerase